MMNNAGLITLMKFGIEKGKNLLYHNVSAYNKKIYICIFASQNNFKP